MADESPHVKCTAHSGLNIKVNLQLISSGVAVILLVVAINLMVDIKGATGERFATLEGKVEKIEEKVEDLSNRVERYRRVN